MWKRGNRIVLVPNSHHPDASTTLDEIRYRISENNLYAYLFGVSSPLEHVMGYFVSVLRERIANFVDPKGQSLLAETEIAYWNFVSARENNQIFERSLAVDEQLTEGMGVVHADHVEEGLARITIASSVLFIFFFRVTTRGRHDDG